MIGVISRVGHYMPNARHPFNQAARLRAIAPLARCDNKAGRQAKRIDTGVNLGRQATF